MRIDVRDLTAGYGQKAILHGVSLQLKPGEFLGLIGPNGAGKSTLLRALTRTMGVMGGSVHLDGDPITRLTARDIARRLAFVPQSEPTLFEFTVREVVLMGRHPYSKGLGGDSEDDHACAVRAMASTDTLQLAERPITELSGGEHRRVLIARALCQNAPTLVLDEPTAHLDLAHQADLLALIRRLADRENAAVLAALHDLNLAAEFCDRLVLLAKGRVVACGTPDEVMTQELLSRVYGAPIHVARNPASGKPFIIPLSVTPEPDPLTAKRVHVICGGGTGLAVFSLLQRWGYIVTAGVLNRLDTDEEAAIALSIEHVTEAPFSRIGLEAISACRTLVERADVVVITDVPIGGGNLANLEMALEARTTGKPVYLLGDVAISSRDFTGGPAREVYEALCASGAVSVSDPAALETALDAHLYGG